MAEGGNYMQHSEAKYEEDGLSSGNEQVEKIYGGISYVNTDLRKTGSIFPWRRNVTPSLTLQQTATLKTPCMISHGETINVQFEVGERLSIMFMFKNKYAVYRKSDGAIAVLSNAEFRDKPTALLDGSKYGVLLNDVEFFLSYAVAKIDHCDEKGSRINKHDVILILAHCKGTFVAITHRKKVGFFPSELVQPITKKRLCIFKGMILKMTAVIDCYSKQLYEGGTYEITKSSKGLFSWFTIDGQRIPLHVVTEMKIPKSPDDASIGHFYENVSEENVRLEEKQRPLPELPVESCPSEGINPSLYRESWFHGNLNRIEAENLLKENGDFLVRYSSSDRETYVLSCKTVNGFEHFKLIEDETLHYCTRGGKFQSIQNLVKYHYFNHEPISHHALILRPVTSGHYLSPTHEEGYQKIFEDLSQEILNQPQETQDQPSYEVNEDTTEKNPAETYGKSALDVYEDMSEENPAETQDQPSYEVNEDATEKNPGEMEEQEYEDVDENETEENLAQESDKEVDFYEGSQEEQSDEEVHVYNEPHDEEQPFGRTETLSPPESERQRRSGAPHETSKTFFSLLCQMELQLSDLKSQFQSITISQTVEKEDVVRRGRLLDTLKPFLQVEVYDQIYYAVAEYLEPELFHKVGKRLGVHRNRRSKIEQTKEDIVERTIDLLDQWHRMKGEQATIGKLINVLDEFHPEDMFLILEELCEELTTSTNNEKK